MPLSKKDLKILELETALKEQTERARAGRQLAAKMFCHLIEVNKWLADTNKEERNYGDIDSHIDFNNKMINTLRNKIKNSRSITVTINDN